MDPEAAILRATSFSAASIATQHRMAAGCRAAHCPEIPESDSRGVWPAGSPHRRLGRTHAGANRRARRPSSPGLCSPRHHLFADAHAVLARADRELDQPFRSSFSPWTNRRVLEAMLTTHWKERDHQMLSRLFLRALHPDLSRVDVARGEPAGPSFWDVVRGMPRRLRYFAGRLSARRGWARMAEADPAVYRHLVPCGRRSWDTCFVPMPSPL